MQVFKCAMRIVCKNPSSLFIYTVALSLVGVVMTFGNVGSASEGSGAVERAQVDFAVIDRDGAGFAEGVAGFLAGHGSRVHVDDDDFALQDAVATGSVDYLLIVPAGWQDSFVAASKAGEEAPALECAYSFYSAQGALADSYVAEFCAALSACIAADPDGAAGAWMEAALDAAAVEADAEMLASASAASGAQPLTFYLKFSIYSLLTSITICVSTLMALLNRTDVRRRNLASPVGFASCNAQMLLACVALAAVVCAWTLLVGFVVFGAGSAHIGLHAASVGVFALVPLGMGYLFGQIGLSNEASNGLGNILALVMSFMGGAWIPLDIVPADVLVLARFQPGYWYSQALDATSIGEALPSWGILLLFALALFAAATAVARLRTQTAAAGGNAAGEAT